MTERNKFSLVDVVDEYLRLRQWVDVRVAQLEAAHRGHLACRAGCCGCCVNLSLFTVEMIAIIGELAQAGIYTVGFDPGASCGWLEGGMCRIYSARPIICRTHGLPVAMPSEEDPQRREVSFCPLNFAGADPVVYVFGPGNTLDLAELNERLCRVNADLLKATRREGLELPVRVELAHLPEWLAKLGEG